ncbi:Zn-dependent protease [Marinobacterium nitratireducens]|uniref:Zn-dependent protease n=1 Tax=Marinobacterium nitratireducens TaxID=518897 RepID=A0A917ZE43_9GAMM|nr:zinc metalloprotease HtpX [Marinobacterium nitratireducens]GGO80812.1 Zn-dependent protease [Marinobacterium nitratireducens]
MSCRSLKLQRWHNRLQTLVLLLGMSLILALCAWLLLGEAAWWLTLLSVLLVLAFAPRVPSAWVLKGAGARPLHPGSAPELNLLVARLAERAGLPEAPRLYWLPDPAPNAFTVGGEGEPASIALSDGLFRLLDYPELSGVLAHEVSHIRNQDVRLMALADTFTRLTQLVALSAQLALLLCIPLWLFGLVSISFVGVALLIMAPLFSFLLQLALSRSREYRADLDASELTGDPEALARALQKLEGSGRRWWAFLVPRNDFGTAPALLRSHPPTASRIRRLRQRALSNGA